MHGDCRMGGKTSEGHPNLMEQDIKERYNGCTFQELDLNQMGNCPEGGNYLKKTRKKSNKKRHVMASRASSRIPNNGILMMGKATKRAKDFHFQS